MNMSRSVGRNNVLKKQHIFVEIVGIIKFRLKVRIKYLNDNNFSFIFISIKCVRIKYHFYTNEFLIINLLSVIKIIIGYRLYISIA